MSNKTETEEPIQESEEEIKPDATKASLNCKIIIEAPAGEEQSKTIDVDFLKYEEMAAIDGLEHDDNVNQLRAAQYFQLKPYKCNMCGSRCENIEEMRSHATKRQ